MRNTVLCLILISIIGCKHGSAPSPKGRVEVSFYSRGDEGVLFDLYPDGSVNTDSEEFLEYGPLFDRLDSFDDVVIVVQRPEQTDCSVLEQLIEGIRSNVGPRRLTRGNLNLRIALKPIYSLKSVKRADRQEEPLVTGPDTSSKDPHQDEPAKLDPLIEVP